MTQGPKRQSRSALLSRMKHHTMYKRVLIASHHISVQLAYFPRLLSPSCLSTWATGPKYRCAQLTTTVWMWIRTGGVPYSDHTYPAHDAHDAGEPGQSTTFGCRETRPIKWQRRKKTIFLSSYRILFPFSFSDSVSYLGLRQIHHSVLVYLSS